MTAAVLPRVLTSPDDLRAQLRDRRVAFVPTMGYLHEGHATLIRAARAEAGPDGLVVVSVFVNPMQFGPTEDLSRYPRDLDRDLRIAAQAGADLLFHPDVATMYPQGYSTSVTVTGVSDGLDGAARPGHFTGVATVVLKLLNLVQPDVALFGEKDWQQLAVVRRMVRDLNVPVIIQGVPTVRAASGLALSSRNTYLTAAQQDRATILSRALRAVQATYATGERRAHALEAAGHAVLAQEPELTLDYLTVVGGDMQTPEIMDNDPMNRVLVAARLFGVRLIDNMPLGETR
ncbi:pantoate--beta-alanine ligase [Deinococcus soli (ex Cha et al. 2016)]|uniref:pantoate--beta-alanine ligase n=1 Tax=Deinococcus soli (ex Cha et al. 2016) TaxID=1309411 RepID=UPI0019A018C3|nr:pantoate--beta-alanine ligase [Deinococcus soli (ex Cha et al. 2016)]GGB57026.1 pantothenate synthetase [Deinococcus soli (ex Cha et al. 2016)]